MASCQYRMTGWTEGEQVLGLQVCPASFLRLDSAQPQPQLRWTLAQLKQLGRDSQYAHALQKLHVARCIEHCQEVWSTLGHGRIISSMAYLAYAGSCMLIKASLDEVKGSGFALTFS